MTTSRTEDLNVIHIEHMPSPDEIKAMVPLSDTAAATVEAGRTALQNILNREDHRLMVVVGPCSIHDPIAGLDYAKRLKILADALSDTYIHRLERFHQRSTHGRLILHR